MKLENIRLPLASFALEIDAAFDLPVIGIFGASGAGKTSLLETIAGLRQPNAGRIALGDDVLFDARASIDVPPRRRRIGYVPQDLALFPHLNVRANVTYGYHAADDGGELFALNHVAAVMEIAPLFDRAVTSLSGGEQQRVAFARAILSRPRLLLLDEPMSSLDSRLKRRLVPFLLRIRDEFHIPLVYVTHDAGELAAVCDEVVVLEQGRIVGRGAVAEVLPPNE